MIGIFRREQEGVRSNVVLCGKGDERISCYYSRGKGRKKTDRKRTGGGKKKARRWRLEVKGWVDACSVCRLRSAMEGVGNKVMRSVRGEKINRPAFLKT